MMDPVWPYLSIYLTRQLIRVIRSDVVSDPDPLYLYGSSDPDQVKSCVFSTKIKNCSTKIRSKEILFSLYIFNLEKDLNNSSFFHFFLC